MQQRVYVRLGGDERDQLLEWAHADRRRLPDQAAYLIAKALKERQQPVENEEPLVAA